MPGSQEDMLGLCRGYIEIMEKKVETTVHVYIYMYMDYIGVILRLYWDNGKELLFRAWG